MQIKSQIKNKTLRENLQVKMKSTYKNMFKLSINNFLLHRVRSYSSYFSSLSIYVIRVKRLAFASVPSFEDSDHYSYINCPPINESCLFFRIN